MMEILRRKRSYCSVNWEILDENCRICDNSLEEKYKLIFYFAIDFPLVFKHMYLLKIQLNFNIFFKYICKYVV